MAGCGKSLGWLLNCGDTIEQSTNYANGLRLCIDCQAKADCGKAKGEPAREYVRRITGNLEPCSKSCATCRKLGPAACPSAKPGNDCRSVEHLNAKGRV